MRTRNQVILFVVNMAAGLSLYGCESTPDSGGKAARPSAIVVPAAPTSGTQPGSLEPVATVIDARPAALIDGRPITWGQLRPTLNELAGAEALAEFILDRRLDEALLAAGIIITPDDAVGERKLLLESLDDDPNTAIRLLDELQLRQKLGASRFDALMRRNAGLRALVRDQVQITEQAVQTMHEMLHGAKRQARLIVLPDLAAAEAALDLLKSDTSFGEVAARMSSDSSAARGGLLEPISRVDPAYAEAVRQALWTLQPGQVSAPILIDHGYAILMFEREVAHDGAKFEEQHPKLEQLVRRSQERLLMEQLAHRLMSQAQVTIFDDSLHEAWSQRGRRTR